MEVTTENIYILKLSLEEIERLWYLSYAKEGGKEFPRADEGRLSESIPPAVQQSARIRFKMDE